MKTGKHYYVACDGGLNVNAEFRHYFRLYKTTDSKPVLVDQGSAPKIDTWEKQYGATFEHVNPYPDLD